MSWLYRTFIRPVLFEQDSEAIHDRVISGLEWASLRPPICEALAGLYAAQELPVTLFGIRFPNPVGLAAGMDKFARALPCWAALGFGFSELGGVTKLSQPGNPSPRLFRAINDRALINRMGFNNPGADAIALKLGQWRATQRWPNHPVGINLGKSKATPIEHAAEDYVSSLRTLWSHADFFVVNVSSPNTPNLRRLQEPESLQRILEAVQEANRALTQTAATQANPGPGASLAGKPILIKVAPDLSFEALEEILDLALRCGVAGIVATNTTVTRPEPGTPDLANVYRQEGGLSGAPLRLRSTEFVSRIYSQTNGRLPVIGVGGIFNADDAWEKIVAGASLVQVYTGLIYEGPGLVKAIVAGLMERLSLCGLARVEDAVGLAHRDPAAAKLS